MQITVQSKCQTHKHMNMPRKVSGGQRPKSSSICMPDSSLFY
uniref:Uncharacterized protein n=1 Tax=Arundo donax TaxID=35708 RepID=A0A0A8ZBB4_ARUDO